MFGTRLATGQNYNFALRSSAASHMPHRSTQHHQAAEREQSSDGAVSQLYYGFTPYSPPKTFSINYLRKKQTGCARALCRAPPSPRARAGLSDVWNDETQQELYNKRFAIQLTQSCS
jgi:hypothetical protein